MARSQKQALLALLASTLALLFWLAPPEARAAQPRAAVTFLEAADQSPATLKSLRAIVEEQLEQHDIQVVRKPAAPLVSKSTRQFKPYARRKHLDRVYDVRLRSVGGKGKVEVVLTERKARTMRSTFSARLSAGSVEKMKKVIPRLVGAVVARTAPEEEAATEPQPQARPQTQVEAQAAEAPAPADPAPAATIETRRSGQFLVGVSVDLGSFLHSAAGLYGATAKVFYQWTALRLGVELGGRGGGGTSVNIGGRADYLFGRSGISPLIGAGVGYLMVKDAARSEGGGGYFSGSVGVEYSRLRPVRFVAEAEVTLPFFSAKREDIQSVNGIVSLVDASAWSPSALFKLGCLY